MLVKPSGRRSWVQRVKIDGRSHDIGLGPYPVVTLKMARDRAIDNRRAIEQGRNPLLEKRRDSIPTFKNAAVQVHATLAPTFKNPIHVNNWIQVLKRHAFPKIGNIPLDRLTQQDVLKVLTPIWTEKTETARRVRQRIRTVLSHYRASGQIVENVADERIDPALPAMPKIKANFRALPYQEMPDAVARIDAGVNSLPTRLCLLFLIHTAARSNEARGATWGEMDLDADAPTWTIPADRMKAKNAHRVPLSPDAVAVLEQARALRNGSDLVFPSGLHPRKPMTSRTLVKALEEIGLADRTVVHGFRTSFKTWAMERTDIPHEVCEMALAHTVGDAVVQAYSRTDLLEKRVRLMAQWSGFVTGQDRDFK